MNAFAPAIQASLLSDARKGASLRRWSVRDLLCYSSSNGNDTAEGVESLLREVQIRLAVQHGKLSSFSTSIEEHAKAAGSDIERARSCLKSLMQLHENTYLLPYRIVDGDWRGLLEKFTRPNRKYVAGVFDEIMSRHGSAVETLADAVIHARGGMERREFGEQDFPRDKSVESFLHSRLMIQLLCDHYISLNKGKSTGAVSLGADMAGVIDDASTEARHVCDANLGVAPEVHIQPEESVGRHDFQPPPIIRSWLHHAIVEVTKNAMTSNVQKHSIQSESIPPGVHISFGTKIICSSKFLRIRIKDQDIGLTNKELAFGFAQSSSQKRWDRLQEQQSYAAVRQPLGSLGVGLPLSRLMLRVFGGNLDVSNNDGEGDASSGCTATLMISYDDSHIAEN
ncbi:hypothetical protein ACHAW5_007492 [Stephanodiscus triporus]|uniref:Protein-serine/threonine kinase n=1 Tax=Stephanodiscus triporus TaxID=2934178 RepID=A0ABD3NP09_9STRA